MILIGEPTYAVSDEIYIVRVLNGFDMCGSRFDDISYIKSLYPILNELKSINADNVHELWEKGSDKEVELFSKVSKYIKFRKSISFGYYCELVNNALNANDGIYAHDIVRICADHLTLIKTGLRQHELEEQVKRYFQPDAEINKGHINEFIKFVLNQT
ncbi:hypothetical protein ACI1TR_01430 [Lactococcus garvieae]|uniref:hypothetical protein n=1 Tax=Lactococcus garvieae TaxID=1363 RepID=UPI003852C714